MAPRSIQRLHWASWMLPLIVLASLSLFGGRLNSQPSSPMAIEPELATQVVESEESLIDDRPPRAAIELSIFTPAVYGSEDQRSYGLGSGFQHLIVATLDQYPQIQTISNSGASFFRDEGIDTPNDVSVALAQKLAEGRRSDLMLLGQITVTEDQATTIALSLYQVVPLAKIAEFELDITNSSFYAAADELASKLTLEIARLYKTSFEPAAQLPASSFGSNEQSAFQKFSQARYQRIWLGNKARAMALLREALEADPRYAYAWWDLAATLDSSTDGKEIEEALRNTIKFSDRLSLEDAYNARLNYYGLTKPDLETRLNMLSKFKADFPFNTRPRELLTQAYYELRDFDAALAELDELILYLPKSNPSAHHQKGHILDLLGRHDEAIEMFKHVADIKPEEPKSWFDLANAHQFALEFDAASENYQRMLSAGSGGEDPFYLNKYAQFLICQGDFDQAETVYDEIAIWADSDQEKISLADSLASYYQGRGRIESVRAQTQTIQELERKGLNSEQELELHIARSELVQARLDLSEGQFSEAERKISSAKSLLNSDINIGTRQLEFDLALTATKWSEGDSIDLSLQNSRSELEAFHVARNPSYDKHHKLMFDAAYFAVQNNYQAAENALLTLLSFNPGDTDHFINLAEYAVGNGQPMKAIDYLNQGPGWCPVRPGPMMVEAEARLQLEEYALAGELLKQVGIIFDGASADLLELRRLKRLQSLLPASEPTQI